MYNFQIPNRFLKRNVFDKKSQKLAQSYTEKYFGKFNNAYEYFQYRNELIIFIGVAYYYTIPMC